MADVTGQFGQEDIILNNAATEATLKQILAMQKVIAANAAQGFKSGGDLNTAIEGLAKKTKDAAASGKKFTESNLRSYKAQQENTDAVDDNTEAQKRSTNFLNFARSVIEKVAGAGLGLLKSANKVSTSFMSMDGSLSSAVSAMASAGGAIKGLGMAAEAFEAAYGAQMKALDKSYDAFTKASQAGVNFAGNVNGAVAAATKMGISLDDFVGMVGKNSEALMYLGGSTQEGAKRLARFGKELKDTPIFNDLSRLGYTSTQMNEGFLNYSKMLQKNGRLQGMTDTELREGTATYLKNLDAVSKLTGQSKEALQAEADARQADAQYRIMMSKLNPKQQAEMEKLMQSIPAAHRTGLKEILATGTATSEEGIRAMAYLKESGQEAQGIFRAIQAGDLQEGFSDRFYDIYSKEAKDFAQSAIGQTLGLFGGPEMNAFVVAAHDVAARQKTVAEIQKKTEEELRIAAENAAKGIKLTPDGEPLIDASTIASFRLQINTAAGEMTQTMNQVGSEAIAGFRKMFEPASKAAQAFSETVLGTATRGDNFEKVAAAAIGAEVALMALAAAAGLAALAQGAGAVGKVGKLFRGKKPPKVPKPPTGAVANTAARTTGSVAGNAARTTGAIMKGVGKTALKAVPVLGTAYMIGDALLQGASAGFNAEEYLGLKEGEAATAGERASSTIGGIVDSLSFGLIDGQNVAKKLVDITGAGINTMDEMEAEIAKEKARLERSLAGEDEYGLMDGGFGRESFGQQKSRMRILEMEKKIAELKEKELAEAKNADTEHDILPGAQFSGGTLGALGKLFGNFGEGTPATLHGMEAVLTPAQMAEVVVGGVRGTMQSFIGNVQNMLTAEEKAAATAGVPMTESEMKTAALSPMESTKSPVELMTELNSSIQELVGLTRMSNALAQKHIGVTSGLTNDAFSV